MTKLKHYYFRSVNIDYFKRSHFGNFFGVPPIVVAVNKKSLKYFGKGAAEIQKYCHFLLLLSFKI
jgi:hypothetical protein